MSLGKPSTEGHPMGALLFYPVQERQGACLRARQGLSARPCNLRGRLRVGRDARGVALDVQESRPATLREMAILVPCKHCAQYHRPTNLSACERPLARPASLSSGDGRNSLTDGYRFLGWLVARAALMVTHITIVAYKIVVCRPINLTKTYANPIKHS